MRATHELLRLDDGSGNTTNKHAYHAFLLRTYEASAVKWSKDSPARRGSSEDKPEKTDGPFVANSVH